MDHDSDSSGHANIMPDPQPASAPILQTSNDESIRYEWSDPELYGFVSNEAFLCFSHYPFSARLSD